MASGTKKIHIGLKWKAVIFLSLVLFILNGGFYFFNLFSLGKQSELQREASRNQHQNELSSLIELTFERLQRLAMILPSLSGINTSLANSDVKELAEAFEPYWQSLNMDLDIHVVEFFDFRSNVLGLWHSTPLTPEITAQLKDQVEEVLNHEMPLSLTHCGNGCILFSTVPILSDGRVIGSLVLGSSIANLLLEMHKISKIDIGLLSQYKGEIDTPLGTWDLQLMAMTNRAELEPVLQTLATEHPLPVSRSGTWTTKAAERDLEINLFPMLAETDNGPLAVLVSDVSRPMAQARQAIHTNALIAIIGLVVSEAILLLLLWRPTSRIRETVELLPLLAARAFDQVHQRIRTQSAHWFEDETDVLSTTADTLARQLEALHAEVSARTLELSLNRDHLQELVDEQTADLKAAKEAAVSANQAKSEFLANMSHELRTPMHAILSFAGLGLNKIDQAPKEKLHRYFTRIHESGNRLLLLLNDLLDLSKLEAERMHIDLQENDLQTVLKLAETEFGELLRNKSLQLFVQPPAVATIAWFDQGRILQVVQNLLSNAIKFSPEGKKISIHIGEATLPSGMQDGDSGTVPALSFTVSDQGIGIPEAELETVFDKFVQSSKTRSGAGGTGLGLAICKEIILRHDGHIWAANNPQGGAEFTFVLPQRPISDGKPDAGLRKASA